MRTVVLRVDQRANSRSLTISAHLEVDGHAIPNVRMTAAVSNTGGGRFDQATMGMLVRAVKQASLTWAEPLFDELSS